jgi:hypothetical protein
MTSDQADLASVQELKDFAQMLSRRCRDVERIVQETRQRSLRELARLRDCLRDIDIESAAAEAALDDDEEQRNGLADEIEELRHRRAGVESAISEIERALARFESASVALGTTATGSFASAESFLDGKVAATAEYLAIKPSSLPRLGLVTDIAVPSVSASAPVDLSDTPLPQGFRWVAIASLEGQLPVGEGEWKKGVSKEQMRRSLGVLQTDVLARMVGSPDIAYDAFVDLDRRAGRITTFGFVHPKSMANIYSVFFGLSPVVAGSSGAGGFTIIDGRHRIAAARELGWTHIPAKII